MENISIGRKLFLTVLSLFLLFAILFIVFQQVREKEYKIEVLNIKLQDYNVRMNEALHFIGNHSEQTLTDYVKKHNSRDLRVTLIRPDGRVFFDNERKDYKYIRNHSNRDEIRDALKYGQGYDINRASNTLRGNYFYSATYFKSDSMIIRTALPYNNDLSYILQADQHYIWFTLIVSLVLVVVLYRFMQRLGDNITKLRIFASRADHNESLDTEDLIEFSDDELGEISEHIIKIYKRLQKTKEEQHVLKRQLTQNIAHELKTPVSSILGYLETILENPNITEIQKQQFLERCYAQSQRLSSLLRDISTLNRLDDAPDLRDFEPVDISMIIANVGKDVALQMAERKMVFVNQVSDHVVINGNPSLVYGIFRNLMDNAITYAGENTIVSVTCQDDGDKYSFEFRDNGIGVANQHLARLFERFYRIDKGRSRKMGGTGLGLAIVKNAVLLHGGTIHAQNNIDGGLCFIFSLKK
jgi:signal transduction histidine kinase